MIKLYKNGEFLKYFKTVKSLFDFIKTAENLKDDSKIQAGYFPFMNCYCLKIGKNQYSIRS